MTNEGNDNTELAIQQKSELVIPQIDANDIATLVDIHTGLNHFAREIKEKQETIVAESLERHVKKIEKGIFKKKRFDMINSFSLRQCYDECRSLGSELIPSKISSLSQNIHSMNSASELLNTIKKETNIFLKYFFLTPVNHAQFEKSINETIPVTDKSSTFFGLTTSECVREFHKTYNETGSSATENMQIMPSILTPKFISFYISRISTAVSRYDTEIKTLTDTLSEFKKDHTEPSQHLQMDINIANHCLEHLMEPPSVITGAYAVQLNTAVSRISVELERKLNLLDSSIANVSKAIYDRSDIIYLAKHKLSFNVTYPNYDSTFPKHLLRKSE